MDNNQHALPEGDFAELAEEKIRLYPHIYDTQAVMVPVRAQ